MNQIKIGTMLNRLNSELTGSIEDRDKLMQIAQFSFIKKRIDFMAGWMTVWYTHDHYFVRQENRGRTIWYKVVGTDLELVNDADSRRIEGWYDKISRGQ